MPWIELNLVKDEDAWNRWRDPLQFSVQKVANAVTTRLAAIGVAKVFLCQIRGLVYLLLLVNSFGYGQLVCFAQLTEQSKKSEQDRPQTRSDETTMPAVFCRFDCDQISYTNSQRARQFAELTQLAISDLPGVVWVDRQVIDTAVDELERSAWNKSSTVSALQLGKIVSAEIGIIGHCKHDPAGGWRLWLELVDLKRADVLTDATIVLSKADNEKTTTGLSLLPIDETLCGQVAMAIRTMMPEALQSLRQRRKMASLAVLHFQNQSDSPRLDFLEQGFINGLLDWDRGSDRKVHVLHFPSTEDAVRESELLADGLADLNAGDRRPIDHFVWGSFREIDSAEVPFPEVRFAMTLQVWNGSDEVRKFRFESSIRERESLLQKIADSLESLELKPSRKPINHSLSERLALELLAHSIELNRVTHHNKRKNQVSRLQTQKLKLLGTAAFILPENKSIQRERILQAHFERESIDYATGIDPAARFLVRFNEYQDWKRFAGRFGHHVRFDYSHLGHRYSIENQRVYAIEESLLTELLPAFYDDHRSWFVKVPEDIPESQTKVWHRELLNQYATTLQLAMKENSDWRIRHFHHGRVHTVKTYIDNANLQTQLLALLTRRHSLLSEKQSPSNKVAKSNSQPSVEKSTKRTAPRKPFVPIAPWTEVPLRPIEIPRVTGRTVSGRIQEVSYHRERLWLQVGYDASRGGRGALFSVDVDGPHREVRKIAIRHDSLGAIVDVDRLSNELWVASPGFGVESLNPKSGQTTDLFTHRDGLPTETIGVFAKAGRLLYCGGGNRREGILGRYDLDSKAWSTIELPPGKRREPLPVTNIAASESRIAVLGGKDNHLIARDVDGAEWTDITERILSAYPKLSFAQKDRLDVYGIAIAQDLLYVASRKGLIGFNLRLNKIEFVQPTKFEISAMHLDGDYLWIGGYGSRLIRFDLASRTFDHRIKISRRYAGHPLSICRHEDRVWYAVQARDDMVVEVNVSSLGR